MYLYCAVRRDRERAMREMIAAREAEYIDRNRQCVLPSDSLHTFQSNSILYVNHWSP